jgi:hypothetical protein
MLDIACSGASSRRPPACLYEDYVQQALLTPCGITDMAIAGNTLNQPQPNEAMHVGQFGENPYNMNVTRMDSHGGWIAVRDDGKGNWWHGGDLPGTTSVMLRTANGMCWGAHQHSDLAC